MNDNKSSKNRSPNDPFTIDDSRSSDLRPMTMYYLALVLPEELNAKVLPLKQMMLDKWDCRVGLKSPAHLTLLPPFWMDPALENDFISDVEALSLTLEPFRMETHDFSAFKPRTIFIDVLPNPQLQDLKKKTDAFFIQRKQYGVKIETRPFHPHITIATRDLYKKAFAEAWEYFEKRPFREAWTVNGLSVLRHNQKNWDVIHTSQFKKV